MGELRYEGAEGVATLATTASEPQFSWRAKQVLALLGALSLLAGIFVAIAGDHSTGQLVTAAAAAAGSLGALGLSIGLSRGHASLVPWTRAALGIFAIVGIVRMVVGLSSASLSIPVDTILAVWALRVPDRAPTRGSLAWPAGLALVALVVISEAAVPLGTAAAEVSKPGPDPNAVIVVDNHSPRALIVIAGSLLETRNDTSFIGPCGGSARITVSPSDYESDGRLMLFIAVDQHGALDAWSATSPGPSETYNGSYSTIPIWSRGDLAGTLPLHLVVHPDFSVSSAPSVPESCTPNPSAFPADN